MWLAKDGHNILVVFPGDYWINLMTVTIPFMILSNLLGSVSGQIVDWIVCDDSKMLLMRVGFCVIFFTILNHLPTFILP
jgi:hypothetical protein